MSAKFTVIGEESLDDCRQKRVRCRAAGQVLGALHEYLLRHIQPGISLSELDKLSYYFIIKNNCKPSFLNYKEYPNTICASVNRVLIHAIPSAYILKANDLLTIDVGCSYLGYHADFAFSLIIPAPKESSNPQNLTTTKEDSHPTTSLSTNKTNNIPTRFGASGKSKKIMTFTEKLLVRKQRILQATELALSRAIEIIRPNINLQQLSSLIYDVITKHGYYTPKEFCGHGIGRKLHEQPYVGNIPWQSPDFFLKEGMIICVEPMLIEFSDEVVLANDNWTVLPADRKALSCHVEHTILVTQEGNEVLTKNGRKTFVENILEKYEVF